MTKKCSEWRNEALFNVDASLRLALCSKIIEHDCAARAWCSHTT